MLIEPWLSELKSIVITDCRPGSSTGANICRGGAESRCFVFSATNREIFRFPRQIAIFFQITAMNYDFCTYSP
jgi:hypothetical protein